EAKLPPWWILNGVRPAGPPKDMGTYERITFSKEQQDRFSIDETGKVTDQADYAVAMKAYKAERLKQAQKAAELELAENDKKPIIS
ncbi:unnamed protein product, partial [Polarella glacialis]